MIELKNINIAYEKTVAVKDLSLQIPKGSITGIVGPNGAGKSTLIKALVGLISEYKGEIYYDELQLRKNKYEVKKMLGYAPEDVDLLTYLSGKEYLQMVADIREVSDKNEEIEKLMQLLNLQQKQNELISEYSHGMKQKLSVAGALISSPPVLIFDEAFNGFDPVSLFNLKSEIETQVQAGGTVVISSHVLDLIEKWCSHIVVMNEGIILGHFEQTEIINMRQKSGKDFNEIFVELINGNI